MPLVGGFSRGCSVCPRTCIPELIHDPYSPRFTLIGSQGLDVKSRRTVSATHALLRAPEPEPAAPRYIGRAKCRVAMTSSQALIKRCKVPGQDVYKLVSRRRRTTEDVSQSAARTPGSYHDGGASCVVDILFSTTPTGHDGDQSESITTNTRGGVRSVDGTTRAREETVGDSKADGTAAACPGSRANRSERRLERLVQHSVDAGVAAHGAEDFAPPRPRRAATPQNCCLHGSSPNTPEARSLPGGRGGRGRVAIEPPGSCEGRCGLGHRGLQLRSWFQYRSHPRPAIAVVQPRERAALAVYRDGPTDDNVRYHVSRATMQWYANNVRRLDWPAQSPDLKPVEHLWDELDRRVRARQARPKSIAQLMEWSQEECGLIPMDVLQTLVESMPGRVAAVIAARDGIFACSPCRCRGRGEAEIEQRMHPTHFQSGIVLAMRLAIAEYPGLQGTLSKRQYYKFDSCLDGIDHWRGRSQMAAPLGPLITRPDETLQCDPSSTFRSSAKLVSEVGYTLKRCYRHNSMSQNGKGVHLDDLIQSGRCSDKSHVSIIIGFPQATREREWELRIPAKVGVNKKCGEHDSRGLVFQLTVVIPGQRSINGDREVSLV
ncbi:hypothetical protein PR048_023719 [Dryococelus australis]|uniref:Transposase n=1 Tax=Dryococelus australis TaxID=614101 RepID=A0ABQ9GUU0_9NEOP|nr:hypothetical protein PR048_023719 [Dryococelus australis]